MRKRLKVVLPKIPVSVVGRDIKVPMRIKYKDPRQVGQDRLVTTYAAKHMHKPPLLVVDFGTAVTFDVVNSKGDYEGGLIFPGIRLALESLVKNTALLPRIKLRLTKSLIGRTTSDSMNKGILFGYSKMCDGLIQMFQYKYKGKLTVIATGGDARLIARYSDYINKTYPDLALKGLLLLA